MKFAVPLAPIPINAGQGLGADMYAVHISYRMSYANETAVRHLFLMLWCPITVRLPVALALYSIVSVHAWESNTRTRPSHMVIQMLKLNVGDTLPCLI